MAEKLSSLGGGGTPKMQEFLTSGIFTVPDGVELVWVTMCGGGGSGSCAGSANAPGSGGASGEYVIKKPLSVTPGDSIAVVIGAGGGGVSASSQGNAGGNTSFGSFTLNGGAGGSWSDNNDSAYAAGAIGGVNSLGSFGTNRFTLTDNSIAMPYSLTTPNSPTGYSYGESHLTNSENTSNLTYIQLSGGAPSLFGAGTDAALNNNSNDAAANSGAGSGANNGIGVSSGDGGSGRVIVEWIE